MGSTSWREDKGDKESKGHRPTVQTQRRLNTHRLDVVKVVEGRHRKRRDAVHVDRPAVGRPTEERSKCAEGDERGLRYFSRAEVEGSLWQRSQGEPGCDTPMRRC
jgi:hypothetical protein